MNASLQALLSGKVLWRYDDIDAGANEHTDNAADGQHDPYVPAMLHRQHKKIISIVFVHTHILSSDV